MISWQQIRERIDAAEPVGQDIAEAIEAARELRDPTLTPCERKLWANLLENSFTLAASRAWWFGPQLIRSAVENQARERAHSANQFADATALRMMELAGFSKEDFELIDFEIRKLIADELAVFFKQVTEQIYETVGREPPDDDDENE